MPRGFLGTSETVRRIKGLIRQGTRDFYVRQKAIDILLERKVKPKDYLGEVKALFEWVQQSVRYTKDAFRVEMVHSARRMLELVAGDCDDMAILLGSMLQSIGHPVRLILTGPDPARPTLFTHIYIEVLHKGVWIPLDPTMPNVVGWHPRTGVKVVVSLEPRAQMQHYGEGIDGNLGAVEPDWLRTLVQAIRGEALKPKDSRVKSLWELLRGRGMLARSPWLKMLLRRIWARGLAARPRPRTTQRFESELRRIGILAGPAPADTTPPSVAQTFVLPGWGRRWALRRRRRPVYRGRRPAPLRPAVRVRAPAVARHSFASRRRR